ncbi:MAG: 1-deoxy-D-xylulose-5-phosphate synthase [Clostridia bacterium]|nr:1-deoxy-D-xylulose-5-phosphate synthase [Clostridia bacterium]
MKRHEGRLLDDMNIPEDIKGLGWDEIDMLGDEIRSLLIEHVSNNGGHLASNLGSVELTMALLRVFDFNSDKIIWDVGHQCYSYKILTGRKDMFPTIRKKDGLSGFPKRSESKYDFFNTGHSSTSISAALGFARAARLRGTEENIIAVIGDGALSGGMAFEALNDAGASGDKIIVILNDNEMSITKNVGGFSQYFSRLRSARIYSGANVSLKRRIEKLPLIGEFLSNKIHKAKSAVKYLFSQGMLFEEMGFQYLGPVDGHDVKKLEILLKDAKKIPGPVLLHVITIKGKGYERAEIDPQNYHGVSKFDSTNGICDTGEPSFSCELGTRLSAMAENDREIVVVCPAVTLGCGLISFARNFPDRLFDVGIAEQHAVTLAAGLACGGMKPVVAGYSTFMQRAYDQILHDICLMNLHVVFTFDRAGIVSGDGATHQGIYDLSYLAAMPNIRIYAPSGFEKLGKHLDNAINNLNCPVVIRYPKNEIMAYGPDNDFRPDEVELLKPGGDCIVFSYGRMLAEALEASAVLETFGLQCAVADLVCLKPLDMEGIKKHSEGKRLVACLEDVIESGSCSQRMAFEFFRSGAAVKFLGMTLPENSGMDGSIEDIIEGAGLKGMLAARRMLDMLDSSGNVI